ncbi:uncharacterized protein LOC144146803 [Haemaphysalis longicornis]
MIRQHLQSAKAKASFGCASAVAHKIFRFTRVLKDRIGRKVCVLFGSVTALLLVFVDFGDDHTWLLSEALIGSSIVRSSSVISSTLDPVTERTNSSTRFFSEAYSAAQSFARQTPSKLGIPNTHSANQASAVKLERTNFRVPTTRKLGDVKGSVLYHNSAAPSTEGQRLGVLTPGNLEYINSTLVPSSSSPHTTNSPHIPANHGPRKPSPGWKVTSACANGLRVLYFVHTAPEHVVRRRFLRKTIGSPGIAAFVNSSLVFFVGNTTDKRLQEKVDAEALEEGDLVKLDFLDTYRNLTLKFIKATKWLMASGCLKPKKRVLVKLDDDVIVNVFLLASYVEDMLAMDALLSPNIYCAVKKVLEPIRYRSSKWFVSKEEYSADKYPPYCAGAAYMMPASVLVSLGRAASRVPFFWIDDVYATGLVARVANVSLIDIARHYRINPSKHTLAVGHNTLFFHWGLSPVLFSRSHKLWMGVVSQKYRV